MYRPMKCSCFFWAVAPVLLIGCHNDATVGVSDSRHVRKMQHNFGLMSPGRKVMNSFAIKNNSQSQWDISRIVSSCACTTIEPKSSHIDPGQTCDLMVEYKAGNKTEDKESVVTVYFEERPPLRLVMMAKVRKPMTVEPPMIVCSSRDGCGGTNEQLLFVRNFTDESWAKLQVSCDSSWLHVSEPVPQPGHDTAALQAWRIVASIQAGNLTAGQYESDIGILTS